MYVRVGEGGAIDAAKPVKEGLTEAQVQALLASAAAQPVRPLIIAPLALARAASLAWWLV